MTALLASCDSDNLWAFVGLVSGFVIIGVGYWAGQR